MTQRIAIIGAGASACFFSYLLRHTKHQISIFEKSRGIGGRCSTRRHEKYGTFNLGAQFFTGKNPRLAQYFQELQAHGLIEKLPQSVGYFPENGSSEAALMRDRFIGTPGMNSFLKYWSSKVELSFGAHVTDLSYDAGFWRIKTKDQEFTEYNACVLTLPYPQGQAIWQKNSKLALPQAQMFPCFALMLVSSEAKLLWERAFLKDPVLAWYACSPFQGSSMKWTVHASADWSAKHLEAEPEWIQAQMMERLYSKLEIKPEVHFRQLHRWRYASSKCNSNQNFIWDSSCRLAYIGDWLAGGRVEGAMESAFGLATHFCD